jgi:hypothetical protein
MRSSKSIQTEIRNSWTEICKNAGIPVGYEPKLPTGCIRLLGTGTKTEKGEKIRVLTSVVYMSPAHELWMLPGEDIAAYSARCGGKLRTLCPSSTRECRVSCLGVAAGRMVYNSVQNARRWKAALFVGNRALWTELAHFECASLERKLAKKHGKKWIGAVRFDGSTDVGIGAQIAKRFPGLSFYDYTKVAARMRKYAAGKYPANYHVTFSFSGRNWKLCREALSLGVNVAAPFACNTVDGFPSEFEGFPVYDADETDVRFLDKHGRNQALRAGIAGLTFKTAYKFAQAVEIASVFCLDRAGITGKNSR